MWAEKSPAFCVQVCSSHVEGFGATLQLFAVCMQWGFQQAKSCSSKTAGCVVRVCWHHQKNSVPQDATLVFSKSIVQVILYSVRNTGSLWGNFYCYLMFWVAIAISQGLHNLTSVTKPISRIKAVNQLKSLTETFAKYEAEAPINYPKHRHKLSVTFHEISLWYRVNL